MEYLPFICQLIFAAADEFERRNRNIDKCFRISLSQLEILLVV